MNYQTREEVIKAAQKSKRTAIQSSIRHWKELESAPHEDLMLHIGINSSECALCERYYDQDSEIECNKCPLYQIGKWCYTSGSPYVKASNIFNILLRENTPYNLKIFRRRVRKMINVLESLKKTVRKIK